MAKQRYHLINTYFEVAKARGMTRADARRLLALEMGNSNYANYSRIWDMTPKKNAPPRRGMPPRLIRVMIRFSISYVLANHDALTWAERLSPPDLD
jgi:hypothetical protein